MTTPRSQKYIKFLFRNSDEIFAETKDCTEVNKRTHETDVKYVRDAAMHLRGFFHCLLGSWDDDENGTAPGGTWWDDDAPKCSARIWNTWVSENEDDEVERGWKWRFMIWNLVPNAM